MNDLIKLLIIITLFYFLLQIISNFCFPLDINNTLIEGLCSAPDGSDTGITLEGECTDPNIWSGCYDSDDNLIAANSEINCGICSNTFSDGSAPPTQEMCETGSPDNYVPKCSAPTGTTDETVIAAAEAIGNETSCTDGGNIWGPAPGTWTPYEWRVGGVSQTTTTTTTTEPAAPATGGTCSDSQYTTEEECIGTNTDNPNGVCNNYDPSGQSNVTTETECVSLFSDSGECPRGGVFTDSDNNLIFSDTLTETECSNAICIDENECELDTNMTWIPPSTQAIWTVNTWTPNVDCVGSWSECTVDCSDSTYTVTVPQSGNGVQCEAANGDTRNCNFGEGACVNPDTTLLETQTHSGSDPSTYEPQTLSNMVFNAVIQPSQPTQPCQPDQTNCNASTSGPLRSCTTTEDCIGVGMECVNSICINQSR